MRQQSRGVEPTSLEKNAKAGVPPDIGLNERVPLPAVATLKYENRVDSRPPSPRPRLSPIDALRGVARDQTSLSLSPLPEGRLFRFFMSEPRAFSGEQKTLEVFTTQYFTFEKVEYGGKVLMMKNIDAP